MKKEKLKWFMLIVLLLVIPIITFLTRSFPSTDFWWYHIKNWFLLNNINLFGFNPYWHLGYPLLVMYAPLSHLIILFVTKITSLNLIYSELIINALTYIFLVISFFLFLKKYTYEKLAYLTALLLAISPRLINEIFIQGHYPNLLSLSFGLLALIFLDLTNKKEKFLFILFMFLSLITHLSFFLIISITTFITLLIIDRKKLINFVKYAIIAVLISSFWLIPAVIESKYWAVSSLSPNPFIFYLLSFGPFLLLILIGLVLSYKQKLKFILTFSLTLIIISLATRYIFPYLPNLISTLLNKIFVETFKTTVTSIIFLTIFLALFFLKLFKTKFKYLSTVLLICYVLFSFSLIYIYIKQDSTNIFFINKEAYKDDPYTDFYTNSEIPPDSSRYLIDASFGIRLLNVHSSSGPPAPMPRRNLYFNNETDFYDFLSFADTSLFITTKNLSYTKLDNLGGYLDYEYDFSLNYFNSIIKNNNLLDYIKNPKSFPSSSNIAEFYLYQSNKANPLIVVSDYYPIVFNSNEKLVDYKDYLIKNRYYIIPIVESKNDLSSIFKKATNIDDIKFIDLDIDTSLSYSFAKNEIRIYPKKQDSETPIYIKINYSPHWHTYVNDKKIPIYNAFPDLMLVIAPSNTDRIILKWVKSIYDYIGIILTIIGIILAFFYIIHFDKDNQDTQRKPLA